MSALLSTVVFIQQSEMNHEFWICIIRYVYEHMNYEHIVKDI